MQDPKYHVVEGQQVIGIFPNYQWAKLFRDSLDLRAEDRKEEREQDLQDILRDMMSDRVDNSERFIDDDTYDIVDRIKDMIAEFKGLTGDLELFIQDHDLATKHYEIHEIQDARTNCPRDGGECTEDRCDYCGYPGVNDREC